MGGWDSVWVEVGVGGESAPPPPQNEHLRSASISGLIFSKCF